MKNTCNGSILTYRHMSKVMYTFDSDYVFNTINAFFWKAYKYNKIEGWQVEGNLSIQKNDGTIQLNLIKSSRGNTFSVKIYDLASHNSIVIRHSHLGAEVQI